MEDKKEQEHPRLKKCIEFIKCNFFSVRKLSLSVTINYFCNIIKTVTYTIHGKQN